MMIYQAIVLSLLVAFFKSQSDDAVSDQCIQQISDFLTVCNANNARQTLQGFQNQDDGTLAMCCYEEDCCSQLNSIIENECLSCDLSDPTNLNIELLQSLSYQSTVCQSQFQLPACFMQQTQAQAFQDRCALQSFNLVLECGFLAETGQYKQDGFSCCWPTNCCEKSQKYLENECNSDCGTEQPTPLKTFANTISRMWRTVCLAPEELETCSVSQVMSAAVDETTTQIPLIVVEDVAGSGVDSFPSNIQEEFESECSDIVNKAQSDSMVAVTQNLVNFCGDGSTIDVLPVKNLCCDLVNQITNVACEYSACTSQPSQLFQPIITDLVLQWTSSNCPEAAPNPQVSCNIPNALTIVSSTVTTTNAQNAQNVAANEQNAQGFMQDVQNGGGDDASSVIMSVLGIGNSGLGGGKIPFSEVTPDSLQSIQLLAFNNLKKLVLEKNLGTFEVMSQMPLYKDFYDELVVLNLEERLLGYPVTVFGLNATSLLELKTTIPEYLSNDWNRTMLSHVALGKKSADDLQIGVQEDFQTLAGHFVSVTKFSEDLTVVQGCCFDQNRANHFASMNTKNGALWLLNGMIYPPGVAEKIYG
eukprot:TRINITY_DN1505_c1_g1_i2.p1 TRINITY_DN1505_c1_g1~~TRINITY_DN1505_c1_g1_i2.p1  ORF type:complete len:587 (-),score=68.87 TRINITY_DN1505_c1_g1_i2:1519-3279(-)